MALIFKALSNPNRLKILTQLMSCCTPGTVCSADELTPLCVGDLGEGLDVAASTLSHHVKELNRAGLIQMQRKGQQVECWLDPDVLKRLSAFFI